MRKNIWNYLSGQVSFQVVNGRVDRFLTLCSERAIPLTSIHAVPGGVYAEAPARMYAKIAALARSCHCRLRLQERFGLCFALFLLRGRYGILAGIGAAILALCIFPNLIWNIRFYDFTPAEQQEMRQMLYHCGVYEGAFATQEDMGRIAAQLRSQTDDYSWIALNLVRGKLIVEKNNMEKKPGLQEQEVTDLVAISDGIIRFMDVRGGYYLVTANQSVREGQTLVTGMCDENGEGRVSYMHSEGEIYAEVEKTYRYTQPLTVTTDLAQSKTETTHRLFCFGLEIPLGSSAASPFAIKNVYREPLSLFGFPLPATIETTLYREVAQKTYAVSESLALDLARNAVLQQAEKDFGDIELLDLDMESTTEQDSVTAVFHLRFIANIAKSVHFGGLTGN